MKKKILYINQYFKQPSEPGITRTYWISQELIRAGYEVTMLSHRNTLLNHVEGEVPAKEIVDVDGIRVIYLRNKYSNTMGVVGRAWSFLSFMFRAIITALREKDVDLVIATSTPLTVAVPALLRKWLRATPFIFEARDLWPEVPIQMGAINNKWIIRCLRWFEKTTYVNAEHVVALSPGMQEGVLQYLSIEKTSMIPNMAKIDQFWPRPKNLKLMEKLGLKEDSFKVIYFGQMGLSNAIPNVIEAIEQVLDQAPDVEFIFFGHGKMKSVVQEAFLGDSRVHINERVPMSEMSEVANFCDVSLVTFSDLPILYTNSPNKLFDSLSAGLAIIVNSNGWTREMVESNDCGLYADINVPNSLSSSILQLNNDSSQCERMGKNARILAENRYDKSILCEEFKQVVDSVMRELEA